MNKEQLNKHIVHLSLVLPDYLLENKIFVPAREEPW